MLLFDVCCERTDGSRKNEYANGVLLRDAIFPSWIEFLVARWKMSPKVSLSTKVRELLDEGSHRH